MKNAFLPTFSKFEITSSSDFEILRTLKSKCSLGLEAEIAGAMDSKEAEELRNNTATEEETLAWNKKRGRRVSFAAEMTSVHIFDRDEDLETPPEAKHDSVTADDVPGFFKDLEDSDDFRERTDGEGKEDDMYGRQPFLQPFESPSPGSAFGSATPMDEDHFFGPVSSEFIRSGRLSDSVPSDDNHEITMDSTAFSMHFRSLANSESTNLKTPTGSHLVFEEKTPTQSGTTIMQGSSMELTRYENSVPHISIPVDELRSGKDSNDMSLVDDNPRKYDYATISPRLDELMSVGSKFQGISTSDFSDGINATNYPVKKSSSTLIRSGNNSYADAQAEDLRNPSVRDSATASDRVREELLANSHSPVHLRDSDSLMYNEQVTEWPNENNNRSSSQLNTATEINEDLDSNDMEAQMASIRSVKPSELSMPVPSFGISTQKEHSHFHSRDDLLKLSETTPTNYSSDQKCQSYSPVIPYPSTLVGLSEVSHVEGTHGSDTAHSISMPNQSPSVAITSLVYGLKVQLDVANTSGLPKLMPSENSEGPLLDRAGTKNLKYSSDDKFFPRLKPNGVASLSCTPVAGDSSIRSKLSSCIVKTPQHSIPVSRLEDKFFGIDQGPDVHKITEDVDDNEFMSFEKLRGSLLDQAGSDTSVKFSSRKNNIPSVKPDGVTSLNVTPVVEDSSIRSKLSSCIVKTPQHSMPVSCLEQQFLSIDQEKSVQKRTANVDDNELMTNGDRKDFPINLVIKSKGTRRMSSQSTFHVEEEPGHPSTLEKIYKGAATTSGNTSSSPSRTHNIHNYKKISRTPDGMVYSLNQSIVSGMSPHHRHSSPDELLGSPRRSNHDVVQSFNTVTDPLSLNILCDNTDNKSNNTIEKILPSQKRSFVRSPSRYEDVMHLELNQQNHADKTIHMSPENDGDLMEIISSGSYLNVVAQKLDNMFTEENLYSRSPLMLINHVKSPLQAHPFLSGGSNGLAHSDGFFQTPLKAEAIKSCDGNIGSFGLSFAPHAHASADESPVMVRTATEESSSSAFEKDVTYLKAPESSVHKRGPDEIITGNEHSTPNVDKPRSPKIPKKGVTECVKLNDCSDDDQSRHGSIVALKHWSAIIFKALADAEQSCPTSFDMLDPQKIELLEDVLIQLEKVHNVTRICSNIQTQSVRNCNNMERNRRISETKELLQKMLYEQAKLKLIRAKREKCLQRLKIVRSGIQHCQIMKLNCSQLRSCVKCNAKAGNFDPQSFTARLEDQQNVRVADHKILTMRQEVGATQRDIDSLTYSFHTCFKMKEKSSYGDSIALINDRFKRRALFKSLREDVQLWEIDDTVYEKGRNQISLNYHGYLTQRFTLFAPISTVTVSYVLNHSNIEKKYTSMDAHIAFSYVFKVDVEQKYVGIRSLAQETQVTSSFLSSLLDVIEEVKLARLELKHLKEARFLSPSAEKLDLCLYFFDYKTGMKVNMTLDVSCLSSGIYPSDVFPSQLQSHYLLTTDSLPAGLQVAVENLKFGFSRILRICRCITKVLASPS